MNSTVPVTITYTDCESSQIHSFGYDATTHTLGVKFHSKGKNMAEPAPPSEYWYFGVPAHVAEAFAAAESKGSAFAKLIRGCFAYEKQPDASGIVFGLSQRQEPKYTVSSKDGRIVNRSTGVAIPDSEPVFILRAKDANAARAIQYYLDLCKSPDHRAVAKSRLLDFMEFAAAHPDLVREPDSSLQDLAGANVGRAAVIGSPTAAGVMAAAVAADPATTAISADAGGSSVERVWNGPVTSSSGEA